MQDKPISTFDEICRITIDTMRKIELETLLQLKKQAAIEFDIAKLTKGCIELTLSLKQGDQQAVSKEETDESQQSLLTNLDN